MAGAEDSGEADAAHAQDVIDILVPMLRRAEQVETLARNIAAFTEPPYTLLWICSPDDGAVIDACQQWGDTHVVNWQPGPGDYARKINAGYRLTSSPWIFTGASDLKFHDRWVENALAQANGYAVVGTNDMHNPVVKRGDHSTHTLIRRAYIDGPGASFDGPGIVYSEAYDHQYVDTELVWLAKRRDVWAHAADSLVEHLHPFWNGRRGMDATYEKGLARGRDDARLFEQRKSVYLSA
mgnify:FL=1